MKRQNGSCRYRLVYFDKVSRAESGGMVPARWTNEHARLAALCPGVNRVFVSISSGTVSERPSRKEAMEYHGVQRPAE